MELLNFDPANDDELPRIYRVQGDSGRDYEVRYVGAPERMNPLVNTWLCDCPARGTCKHVRLVADAVNQWGDARGYE